MDGDGGEVRRSLEPRQWLGPRQWRGPRGWSFGLVLLCLIGMPGLRPVAAQSLGSGPTIAWLDAGTLRSEGGRATPARVPLGSLWKLFVYAYVVAEEVQAPAYRCEAGQRKSDEEYCCDPGEAVSRDAALQRSCGPFFEPARLGLQAGDWQRFWQTQQAPAWLHTMTSMQPDVRVPLEALLQGLDHVPVVARAAAREALLPNTTRREALLGLWGSGPRFKTWSWFDESAPDKPHAAAAPETGRGPRVGGAAGWLADGSPFWFGAPGTSGTALAQHGAWAAPWVQRFAVPPDAQQPCVRVRFFARYPLTAVRTFDGRTPADGPLSGRLRLEFRNGQWLTITAVPALELETGVDGPRIQALLPLEEYVARVIDREGDAQATAAARALAVAARSWLINNAPERNGCREVDDSSQAQRVSANPPSAAARAAAAFTDGLLLKGTPIHYHSDRAGSGLMSWTQAVAAHQAGEGFQAILLHAYPQADWSGVGRASQCEPIPEAAAWLREREHRWREPLRRQIGYEATAAALQVCRLDFGTPHSDARRLQIRVREWFSREGRATLLHEYLHLAFRHHPNGQDEVFIEGLAQALVDR